MRTIVEPKQHIYKMWGKQQIRYEATYRMMRYILRVDHDDKVLLHNVVTGQLVVLEQLETEALERLPLKYESVLEQLVTSHYLVPEDYDEHHQVMNLRTVFRRLDDAQQDGSITGYCILPTTSCNARCYYCYENGIEAKTMTIKTAEGVVEFIRRNSGDVKKVAIQWFGGEPTLASARIDQICQGLQAVGIDYVSTMITNGYLFDRDMVAKAKNCWHLAGVQVSVDGTEAQCNRIKAFSVKNDSPYRRIIQNVGLLIENKIHVGLRMNFDLDNEADFEPLVHEIVTLYGNNKFLEVYAYPIIGAYARPDGTIHHGSDQWLDRTLFELNNCARKVGLKRLKNGLPFLKYRGCAAQRNTSITILPDGTLVKCVEQLKPEQIIGDLHSGIIDNQLVESWKRFADYDKCIICPYYPECIKPYDCSGKDQCLNTDRRYEFEQAIRNAYNNQQERNDENDFHGTESRVC